MQSVEPVLENAIKTLQKVVDVRGMGKASFLQIDDSNEDEDTVELIVSDFGQSEPDEGNSSSKKHHAHHHRSHHKKQEQHDEEAQEEEHHEQPQAVLQSFAQKQSEQK